jgi:hypothetical protein
VRGVDWKIFLKTLNKFDLICGVKKCEVFRPQNINDDSG